MPVDKALRPDFVSMMTARSEWPAGEAVIGWFQRTRNGIRKSTYRQLKLGRPQRWRVCHGFCTYLIETRRSDGSRTGRIDKYLAGRGLPALESQTADSLFDALFEDPTPDGPQRHWLLDGIKAIADIFPGKRWIDRYAQSCRTPQAVHQAARWAFAHVGRECAPPEIRGDTDREIAFAESYQRLSVAAFEARLNTWVAVHEWIVVLARGNEVATGVSIMLPLTPLAFRRIRDGEMESTECTADDFVIPSRHIFIETVAQRPSSLHGEPIAQSTKSLLIAGLAQIGVLTKFCDLQPSCHVTLLSFAVVDENRRSLEAYRFTPTGGRMKGCRFELYERILPVRAAGIDAVFSATLGHLSRIISAPPEP